MLAEIMENYKSNCQNESFCISRISEVLSIKTAAYQDIDFYQNQIGTELQKQKAIHGSKDARGVLGAVKYQLAEYQLACHIFAFSSFLDVLLQRNFENSLVENAIQKALAVQARYDELYRECYNQIEKYQSSSIEAKILGGIGNATKGLGKAIGTVPVLKEGSVERALIKAGDSIGKYNEDAVQQKLQELESFESSKMAPFIENLEVANLLHNTENAMITDGENLYILKSK